MSLRESFELPEKLKNIYTIMDVSPVGILRNYALNLIYGKVSKYEVEIRTFEKKYRCSFEEFKNKIELMDNEENFEWEDDFMDWQFASENLLYWKKKMDEIMSE